MMHDVMTARAVSLILLLRIAARPLAGDLAKDYINAHDAASRLNRLMKPERAAYAVFCVLMLCVGRWGFVLCNAPLIAWHGYQVAQRRRVDPTRLLNGREYSEQLKREGQLKLAFYSVVLFKTVWSMSHAMVAALFGSFAPELRP